MDAGLQALLAKPRGDLEVTEWNTLRGAAIRAAQEAVELYGFKLEKEMDGDGEPTGLLILEDPALPDGE